MQKDNEIKTIDNNVNTGQHNNVEDLNKINSLKSQPEDIEPDEIIELPSRGDSPVDRVKFEGIGDDDSICSSESSDDDEPPPIPDGGWGWVVVFSSFIVSGVADGLANSFGSLQVEFTQYFNTTQATTSFIGSLFIAAPLLVGPIMSAIVDRYGCRAMTMAAGVVSAAGFLLASVSNSVQMLCLTYGLLSGLSIGVLHVTAVVSVAFWFDKKRNLAVSLASCGIGFGTLAYSPMTDALLTYYGWRSTIIFLAGTLLNMCVCGALMRTPEWLEIKQKTKRRLSKTRSRSRKSSASGSISSRSIGGDSVFLNTEEIKQLLKSGQSPEYILRTLVTTIAEAEKLEATTQMNAEQYKRVYSDVHLPTFVQHNEKVPTEVIEKLMTNKRIYNIILANYPDLILRRHSEVNLAEDKSAEHTKVAVKVQIKKPKSPKSEDHKSKSHSKAEDVEKNNALTKQLTEANIVKENGDYHDVKTTVVHDKTKNKEHVKDTGPVHQNWFTRQISTDHHYLKNMRLYRSTMVQRGAMMNIPRYKLRASSVPNIYRNSTWSIDSESDVEMKWYHRIFEATKSSFDFKMFTEFHFLIFNLASLILAVWFVIPYFFLQSFMEEQGVAGAPILISIIGISCSIGIVVLGWAGDQPWLNVTKAYAICLIVCGISLGAYPIFIKQYWALGVISAIFGFSIGSSYSYTPAILMELMPLENFTVAYGLILLSQGIGHLVGPPLGGLIQDVTQTFHMTFYTAGVWLIISGLCVGIIPYTRDFRMCGSGPLLKDAEETKTDDSSVKV